MGENGVVFDLSDIYGKEVDGFPTTRSGSNQIPFGDLEIFYDDELGSGNFSQVCKGVYCGTEVAIKKIKIPRNDPDMMKYLKREVCLLNAIRHPHVVQFLGWSQPEDSEFLLLVEEFAKGGNLSRFLSRNDILVSWDTRISICLDVARAMLYLHKNKVIYRDLKSENILIDDTINPRVAKICDFGLARSISEYPHASNNKPQQQSNSLILYSADRRNGPPMSICGTDEWMAPEVILGMEYDERSDVFSYGVLMLECILGTDKVKYKLERTPRNHFELDAEQVRTLAKQAQSACPKDMLELALFCCAYEPNNRPDFHEILVLLMNIAAENDTLSFEDIKLDPDMAEQLNENLSKTEPSSPRTPEARLRPNAGPGSHSAPASGQNSATNLRKILEAKPFINLDSIEYVRVESMPEPNTHWNVRISPNATVKDVCDKLAKKIDEKYTIVQLYIMGKKKEKNVLLGADQTISNVKVTFGSEKSFKFGVNYLESTHGLSSTSQGSIQTSTSSQSINGSSRRGSSGSIHGKGWLKKKKFGEQSNQSI